ncbi:MAG: hypothetical protein C0402_09575 [Thermodesulfovibrio sp.]|nr:hypothetical protein [Thermodesulfovibrio sp.]
MFLIGLWYTLKNVNRPVMKYIYYIISISLLVSAIAAYQFVFNKPPKTNAALIINDRIISRTEFDNLYAAKPVQIDGQSEFINTLITKELMIQEAQKEGIDKDPAFRKAIQNYYEQSLIKLLMDRKFSRLPVEVSENDIDHYIALQTRNLHLTIANADSEAAAAAGTFSEKETKVVRCRDLSEDIREKIITLKEGESTKPVKAGASYMVIRLDKTEPLQEMTAPAPNRKTVRLILAEQKKQQAMDQWMSGLRQKATISDLLKEGR